MEKNRQFFIFFFRITHHGLGSLLYSVIQLPYRSSSSFVPVSIEERTHSTLQSLLVPLWHSHVKVNILIKSEERIGQGITKLYSTKMSIMWSFKSSKAKQVKNKMTHCLNILAVCAIDCKTWILIFIKVHILIFKVLLWLLKTKHNYVCSTKKHITNRQFHHVMLNMRCQVSFFFFNISQSKTRKVTIISSTGMQNSTIIKEMRYVSIVYDLLFTFLFFLFFSYSHICLHIDTNHSST